MSIRAPIPYVVCPCGGRAEIDPSNPYDDLQCEDCGREAMTFKDAYRLTAEAPPWYEEIEAALTNSGYVYTGHHGWRTEADENEDAPFCEGECCHPGVERRGRWE